MQSLYLIIAYILIFWIFICWHYRAHFKLAYQISESKWHTFFGWVKIPNINEVLTRVNKYHEMHGPICIYWFAIVPVFLCIEPQIINEILTSKNCIKRPSLFYGGLTAVFGNGLISSNGPIWYRHRKVMNRAFSHKILNSYISLFHKDANKCIEEINKNLDEGKNIDLLSVLRKLTLKLSTKTILKKDLDHSNYNIEAMEQDVDGILDYLITVIGLPFLQSSWIRKIAEVFIFKNTVINSLKNFKKLINDSLNCLKNNDTSDPSYCANVTSTIECAIKGVNEQVLQIDEMNSEVFHLYAAAFETSTTSLFAVLALLAMHPEYQERAYEEISSVLTYDGIQEDITLEHLEKMVYLDMVINESLRLMPMIPFVLRQVTDNDVVLSNGITLPVGQVIGIDIFSLHHSKEVWGPDADNFNPDNFLPANVASRHPFSFIPFTKGQRFCIGWRYATIFLKIVLSNLIKTYKFSTDFKYENLRFRNHVSLKLMEEPKLILEKRN